MADFYGTATGMDAYFLARNNVLWTAGGFSDEMAEAALLVASTWVDGHYSSAFPGRRTLGRAQPREWPRDSAMDIYGNPIPSDSVPVEIEYATYEVALRQLVEPGSLNVDYVAAEGIKQASVDGAVSVTYNGSNSAADVQLNVAGLSEILYPILSKQAGISSGLSGRSIRW